MVKKIALVIMLIAGMAATPALAGPIGDTGSFNYTRIGGYYAGNGGEFTAYNLSGLDIDGYTAGLSSNIANPASFQTFCLETGEYTANPMYFVVASGASAGGVGGTDPISMGTAWLYSQFALGTLSNYFTGTRSVEAGLLQNAFWYLEGEGGAQNAYTAAAASQFGGLANAMSSAAPGYLDVYVLNNYSDANRTVKAQDWLYRTVPDGGATLMLLGGALMGLGALRRKLGR
ncbi:MAG: VPDSG-CTERM sorting domain-containing protein [Polyangiaceae bacterium]|nr:VPDSG-CTERM sorting domain-containing protein [Polyangiaceae bacterium]